MRSIVLAAQLLVVIVPSPSHAAQQPDPVTIRREAEATWLVNDSTDEYDQIQYSIWVRRISSGQETATRVRLTKYGCEPFLDGIYCRPLEKLNRVISNDRFQFDDTLTSARLSFRAKGARYSGRWSGRSTPGRSEVEIYCGQLPAPFGRGIGRDAEASGSLFNQHLESSDSDRWGGAYLSLMAYARPVCRSSS